MANSKVTSDNGVLVDGSFDFSGGVDSSKVTTIQSELNPNGLPRNMLSWLNNATLRTIGILQRTGWQPLVKIKNFGRWQGGFIYEPDGANPYLVCSISGHIYKVLLESPYAVTELVNTIVSPWTHYGANVINGAVVQNPLLNPVDSEMAFFCQGENQLIIQAGDYFTATGAPTLPLFWNGTTLRRSIGITTGAPLVQPGQNEIPAATVMDYYGNRIWYAQARVVSGGDMLGALSGTVGQRRRDAILNVTENALCFSGDGFSVPTNAGNIRAIKHSSNLNAALGQGQLYIFTRKAIYQLTVPTTRTDWINANTNNQPRMDVVQLINGAVGDRCVVPVNGDLFYQSFEPSIRSLIRAQTQFGQGQWGNTPISQNEERALQFNDRGLMRFSSGIEFNNRILQAALPVLAADGVNVVHQGILPLDFDLVTNLEEKKAPVWEGIWDGGQILQLFTGDFGGLQRAFYTNISDEDGSINVWEMTTSDRMQNGDNRVTWGAEFPAYTWSTSGYEYRLKQLNGGELWIDKVAGTVDFDVYYRADAEPCWRHWFHHSVCAGRCEDQETALTGYPCEPTREGYVFTVAFPEPYAVCNQMHVRPTTIGYQFQVKIVLKGWCRIRGLLLYALPKQKPQFQGIACPPNPVSGSMFALPNPFQVPVVATPLPTPVNPIEPEPPTPPTPTPIPPNKAVNPNPANGATGEDPTGVTLSWNDGGGATSFNVYFNGVLQGNQTGTTFPTGALAFFSNNTWRIDSVNAAGTTTGDTWSFDTGFHPVVVAWAARVLANGGTGASVATKIILSQFCSSLDSSGLMPSMIAMNCFVPGDTSPATTNGELIRAITPLICIAGNSLWTNNGPFLPGDLTVDGLVGSNPQYLDTGVIASTAFADNNSAGFSIYSATSGVVCDARMIAMNGPASFASGMYCDSVNMNSGIYGVWNFSPAIPGAFAPSDFYFCSDNRTTANDVGSYMANSIVGFNTIGTSVANPTSNRASIGALSMYLNCWNRGGVAQQFSLNPVRFSFTAVHFGLTAAQTQSFFNIVQTLRQALGGGHD